MSRDWLHPTESQETEGSHKRQQRLWLSIRGLCFDGSHCRGRWYGRDSYSHFQTTLSCKFELLIIYYGIII